MHPLFIYFLKFFFIIFKSAMIINVSWIAFNDFCFELQPVSWVAELKSVLNFSMTSLDRLFNGSIEWTHNLNDFL